MPFIWNLWAYQSLTADLPGTVTLNFGTGKSSQCYNPLLLQPSSPHPTSVSLLPNPLFFLMKRVKAQDVVRSLSSRAGDFRSPGVRPPTPPPLGAAVGISVCWPPSHSWHSTELRLLLLPPNRPPLPSRPWMFQMPWGHHSLGFPLHLRWIISTEQPQRATSHKVCETIISNLLYIHRSSFIF